MRIHAEVDVVNRQLAAQGMKKNGKRCKSQLAIGRKPLAEGGQEVVYDGSTLFLPGVILSPGVPDALQSVKQGWGQVSHQGQCGKPLHQDDRGGESYYKVHQIL